MPDSHATGTRAAVELLRQEDRRQFGIRVSDASEADIAAYLEREPYPDAANIREIVRAVAIRESAR